MSAFLNIGCGDCFNKEWTNIDIHSNSPYVKQHDIRKGLPYRDESFDAVYCSHLLEHLTDIEVSNLLNEISRVLKKGGICRVVVPDLEKIAQMYLECLKNVKDQPSPINEANYDWMMLELYDQTVRGYSGGKMGKYLMQDQIHNKEFIISRIGFEVQNYWNLTNKPDVKNQRISYKSRAKQYIKNLLKKILTAPTSEINFREHSGEIHRWMYDSFSLSRILEKHGLKEIHVMSFNQSRIDNFNLFGLEDINGLERKPDSLYIETIK